jgi:hypothetical protein
MLSVIMLMLVVPMTGLSLHCTDLSILTNPSIFQLSQQKSMYSQTCNAIYMGIALKPMLFANFM